MVVGGLDALALAALEHAGVIIVLGPELLEIELALPALEVNGGIGAVWPELLWAELREPARLDLFVLQPVHKLRCVVQFERHLVTVNLEFDGCNWCALELLHEVQRLVLVAPPEGGVFPRAIFTAPTGGFNGPVINRPLGVTRRNGCADGVGKAGDGPCADSVFGHLRFLDSI